MTLLTLPDKTMMYDWFGLNESIFRFVNSFHGETYDLVMLLLTRIGDRHNFPYYMGALIVCALLGFIAKKIHSKGGAKQSLVLWLGVLLVLVGGYFGGGWTVKEIKETFAYPRPYAVLSDVHMIDPGYYGKDDDHHSFPSGHAFFITLMVIGLWPVLSDYLRSVGLFLILGVGWSRMAVGMHFPADVLAGIILGVVVTAVMQMIVSRVLSVFRLRT